ncbi:galactosylgalactosylxylosylprotein 3-beta-glucuronosyltransferase P-like [Folsomia candida]|uniref:Galactosylgalactosylxylosylprotein 3-beta-glucuronosyltransferase n=1 Tax=Folsomia candida TaxID=158441 RepID=A0A226DZH6_FOLCA|nr:galactosylgalactosylxylosylprotein 3-beta-glucuronosyltransferase P-like [Folsomia candida]OXA50619.1 Galactosylgalactosylxylosylprotein 3-beta-glucuronosyltransferase S [Folsomia candida]
MTLDDNETKALLTIMTLLVGLCSILILVMITLLILTFGYPSFHHRKCPQFSSKLRKLKTFAVPQGYCRLIGGAFLAGLLISSIVQFSSSIRKDEIWTGQEDKLVFITTTQFALDQVATLTKIAQSLYPVRNDGVLWVIVSLTEEEDLIRTSKAGEGKLRMPRNWAESTKKEAHLNILNKTLTRFRVPFVLLEKGFVSNLTLDDNDRNFDWSAAGVQWALDNVQDGVLMLGTETWSYHHRIFKEVMRTRLASTWPVGLGKWAGFSAPIWSNNSNSVTGYFDGDFDDQGNSNNEIPLLSGGTAVRIQHLRKKNRRVGNLVKVILNGYPVTLQDLEIPFHKIELLGNKGTQILVWRTESLQQPFPATLRLKPGYTNSNMVTLWKNFFTVMYDQIPVDEKYRDKNYSSYL